MNIGPSSRWDRSILATYFTELLLPSIAHIYTHLTNKINVQKKYVYKNKKTFLLRL